jgi:putative transposase
VILVDPRKHRPSQTDPVSGEVRKKSLNERTHTLPDGRVIGRDQAAAWVLWNIGQRILGEEQARSTATETVARAA